MKFDVEELIAQEQAYDAVWNSDATIPDWHPCRGSTMTCPSCGATITLDDEGFGSCDCGYIRV